MWDEVAGAFACTLPVPMMRRTSCRGARPWGPSTAALIGIVAASVGACGDGTGESAAAPSIKVDMPSKSPIVGPTSVPTKMGFLSVWGSSDTDVWAVGDSGTAVHFDGHAWSLIPTGVTEVLTSVHGTGPDDVWVAGADGDVLHWTGAAWTIDNTLDGTTLLGVWATGPNDVWVSGVDESDGVGSGSLFGHWTGTAWDFLDINGAETLWKIWASGPTDIWMVGTAPSGDGIVYRGDGKIFDPVPFTGGSVHSIWGSGPADVWVAPSAGALQHWTGAAWTTIPTLTASQALFGISGSGPADVWTVGQNGVVGHYGSDATWSLSSSGTTATLFSVWSPKPGEAWLVGGVGTVLRWDGTTWL